MYRALDAHGHMTRIVYVMFVSVFLLHGIARALLVITNDRPWL